jgi:hypothetical protein
MTYMLLEDRGDHLTEWHLAPTSSAIIEHLNGDHGFGRGGRNGSHVEGSAFCGGGQQAMYCETMHRMSGSSQR